MPTNPYNDDKRLLELLEHWQSGDFSRANEQELKALADSDDFRREAVEGFLSLPEDNHARHLASLREKLRKRIGAGRRVLFPHWMAAAAALALLILAAIWFMPSTQKTAPTAQQEAQPALENQPIASNLPEVKSEGIDRPGADLPKPDEMVSQSAKPGQTFPTMAETGPSASGVASDVATAPAPVRSEEVSEPDMVISGKPEAAEAEYGKVLDEQDEVDLFPGNAAKRAEPKKDPSAPGRAKDSVKKKSSTAPKISQPAGGWGNFQDYLRRNARLPETARQNNVSGSVLIQFRLDENSLPIDFQILRALGHGCDEEAIRLVKAHAWQRGGNPELTVEVPFVR